MLGGNRSVNERRKKSVMVGVSDAGQIQRSVKLIVFLIAMSTVVMFVSIRTRFGSEASSQPCTKSGAQQILRILELRKKIVRFVFTHLNRSCCYITYTGCTELAKLSRFAGTT